MKKKIFLVPLLAAMLLSGCSGSNGNGGTPLAPVDHKAQFARARDNTQALIEYQYDFNVSAKIKFKSAVSFSPANYSGTTYVNSGANNTQFLQKRVLSGALVFDSTTYVYNVGTDLVKLSEDENKDFSVINHETVPSVYDFDKNNFGCILKNLHDDGLLGATYADGKYDLTLHTNFSQDSILSVLNHIDSKLILKALNSYTQKEWGVGLEIKAWATLDESTKYLKEFNFDAYITIKDVFEIGVTFNQKFTKYSGVEIVTPTFENTKVSQEEVQGVLNEVCTALSNSTKSATSYYDYKTKTAVDHGVSKSNPLGLAVNSTTQGVAKRQVIDNTTYFNNRLMVDSDYKNADQYGDLVADYDSYRAKLTTGEVYDVYDPKVGFNKYKLLEGYNEGNIDENYMLPDQSFFSYDNIKVAKVTTDSKNNKIYKLGLSTEGVRGLLDFYNKSIRIDYERKTIFDIYKIKSDFNPKKASFVVTINNENKLVGLDIDLKGFYIENDSDDQVKFRLETEIDYDWSKSYTAVSNKEDIDN